MGDTQRLPYTPARLLSNKEIMRITDQLDDMIRDVQRVTGELVRLQQRLVSTLDDGHV